MSSEQQSPASMPEEFEQPIAHLGNIAFWVSNYDAMRRFYSEIVGVPEMASGSTPRNWVFYGNNEFSFSLNHADISAPERGWARCPRDPKLGDAWDAYMTIYVADLMAVIKRCRAEGLPLHTDEPFSLGPGFGTSIEVKDPDGNTVAITQR